jgi:hypothetical protein
MPLGQVAPSSKERGHLSSEGLRRCWLSGESTGLGSSNPVRCQAVGFLHSSPETRREFRVTHFRTRTGTGESCTSDASGDFRRILSTLGRTRSLQHITGTRDSNAFHSQTVACRRFYCRLQQVRNRWFGLVPLFFVGRFIGGHRARMGTLQADRRQRELGHEAPPIGDGFHSELVMLLHLCRT